MIKNILETINAQAAIHPDSPAYDYLGRHNSYRDLKEYSDSLAAYIDCQPIKTNAPIMIFGGQEFSMIASFLAAAKSGHAYIPVDVNSPSERLTAILTIADPALVIACDALPIKISDRPVIQADQLANIFLQQTAYKMTHAVTGDDTFYIIFTSGTTGQPKGVQISSSNILSFANWQLGSDFNLPEHASTLAQAPFSFDLSVMDWIPALLAGGQLRALPKEVADNFKKLFEILPQYDLQVFVSTPSFAEVCLINPDFDQVHLPQLSHFLFCGEELTKKTADKLQERFPGAKIFNTYGPTEATVAVSGVRITQQLVNQFDRLPVGYVKSDTQVTIFDEQGKPVPCGQSGEIIIYGPSVSKGYLNNPQKTAAAFFHYQGQRAYRTGDLGSLDARGLLHYEGRKDFQIKLHGYRIELEEVNHGLSQSDLVKQAVAIPRYDSDHKVAQLLAWVVPKDNQFAKDADLTKALKEDLKERMMSYMIPSRFVYKDSLPISANGKIDIKKAIAEVNNV
ncbi:MAG: D-alanine--poly(phosphoribitol) ligase subunit DltA [Oenococcus sp.]|uniref:D-alanine--poly(phosphoribitol) ligase subunit DltA n=1 Tax=Oenococcus sp. TaxID=1979414 RepID=UPI0039EBA211